MLAVENALFSCSSAAGTCIEYVLQRLFFFFGHSPAVLSQTQLWISNRNKVPIKQSHARLKPKRVPNIKTSLKPAVICTVLISSCS